MDESRYSLCGSIYNLDELNSVSGSTISMKREKTTLLREAVRVRSMTTKCRASCRTNCFRLKPETNLALMLCLVFYLYICLGGALFLLLEGRAEAPDKTLKERERLLREFSPRQQVTIHQFCDTVNRIERGKRPDHVLWSFMESTDFAYQVVTAQGTMQTTRLLRTTGAKISYIIFVFLGIPLTILTLRATGQRLNILVYSTIRFVNVKVFHRQLTPNIHIKAVLFNTAILVTTLLIGMTMYSLTQDWTLLDSMFYTISAVFTISNSREQVVNKDIENNSDKDIIYRFLFNLFTFFAYTVLSSTAWSAHHFTRHMRFKAQNQRSAKNGSTCPWVEVTSQAVSPSKSTRDRETDRESVC